MDQELKGNRIWELDFFRGVALLLMIYFHVIFDMKDIFNYNINYSTGINYFLGKISALLFIFISGISSHLSKSNTKRGLRLLGIALVITLATHLYSAGLGIKFGILHFLAICMLLAPMFKKMNIYLLLILATAIIAIGNYFSGFTLPQDFLFVFGLISSNFVSSDYYPLLPWMGIFLYGMAAGQALYSKKRSIFSFSIGDNPISKAGRHTLLYYLIHQPVIIVILTLINRYK